jgi:hypothetical protein
MDILLHTCCAACLIFPLERLRAQGFQVEGFFYNPNIHSFSEFNARKLAVEQISANLNFNLFFPQYHPEEFFHQVNAKEEASLRCPICWGLRLKQTALQAKQKGARFFSTTLLVSPYQDQEVLKELGEKIALETQVEFYYEDFRPGFRKAHEQAKAAGVYCQKYCGCIYSEMERFQKSKPGGKK